MDCLKLQLELDKDTNKKVINQRYRLLQTIGQGQSGKVLLAEDLQANPTTHVAIKTINRIDKTQLITKTYLSHATKIKREIQIMKGCNHPNVVKLYMVIDDLKFDKILLVLQYCKFGEIDWKKYNHYYEKYTKPGDTGITLNKILRDVINGLEYLHTYKRIIHRDLKPSNLLISSDRTIKISDFGVSLILENNANDDKELGKTMGTPAFYAPELCQFVNNRLSMFNEADLAKSQIDARIDIWSLGVILYCLFFHSLPFEGANAFGLFKNIVNGQLKFPKTRESSRVQLEDLEELSLLKDVITKLLSKNPNDRPTLAELKRHKFTTFELSKQETKTFLNFNNKLMAEQNSLAERSEAKLSSKIKNLFSGSKALPTEKAPPPPIVWGTSDIRSSLDLENVDDLLDSYLDDSSSFGSDMEAEAVDTTDLLSSISDRKSLFVDVSKNLSRGSIPPPLKLEHSNLYLHESISPASLPPPPGIRTPGSNVVTVGLDSPLSATSVSSHSGRAFSKLKPTITSLYSPDGEMRASGFSDWAPPPTFGRIDKRKSTTELICSTQSSMGRNNSLGSSRSNFFGKMSSSSSLLNLHGYLTDESTLLFGEKWRREVANAHEHAENGSRDEANEEGSDEAEAEADADETFQQDEIEVRKPFTMDQFLDRLDRQN